MSPIYNYKCPSGHFFETIAPVGSNFVKCDCGKTAKRTFDEIPGGLISFPGSYNHERNKGGK